MSYLALPDSPMSTLVVNWLVFDDGLAGVEVMSRPLTWRCRASPAAPPAVGVVSSYSVNFGMGERHTTRYQAHGNVGGKENSFVSI